MTAIADRRANGIRTRNRPVTPGAPYISDLEKAAAGGVATLGETTTLVPTSQLGTGAPDATKALFGDQTWQAAATAAALAAEITARVADVDAEEAARIAADAAHVAAADPHAQYQREVEKDANNGYLGADANARLTSTRLSMSATDKLLGRSTAGAGASEEIVCTAAGRALIDDASASVQRTTLGLGTSAVLNVPAAGDAAAGEVVKGNDSRMTNSRTPSSTLAHQATHIAGGTDPIAGSCTAITEINDVRRLGANVPAFIGRAYGAIPNGSVTHVSDPGQALLCVGLSNGENVAAIYLLTAAHTVILLVGNAAIFTVTAGNPGTFNVYWSAGNVRFELENNRGGARNVTPALISLPQ